jgi:hypothetical protein
MSIDRVSPDFFTGVEVENSPAKGMRTLFVVGVQPVEKILEIAAKENIRHIYVGANMSLHGVEFDDHDTWLSWDNMVYELLDSTIIDYITVDVESNQVEGFLENRMSEDHRVIPMISVKLPYTKLLNYNTTIKIDDKGFDQTNPGVWCHSLHKLMDRETFTPWSAYVGDNPVT